MEIHVQDELIQDLEARLNYKVNKSDLSLGYIDNIAIHQIWNGEPAFSLFISLTKELNKEQVGPAIAPIPFLSWGRNISEMNECFHAEWFIAIRRVEVGLLLAVTYLNLVYFWWLR